LQKKDGKRRAEWRERGERKSIPWGTLRKRKEESSKKKQKVKVQTQGSYC